MSTTTFARSIHIDAPVETVFGYVKDPRHVYDAVWTVEKPGIADLRLARDAGVGSSWTWMNHVLFFHLQGTVTRREFVANERIVDGGSTGTTTYSMEPEGTGTRLSLEVRLSSRVPFLDKAMNLSPDHLDTMLANLKHALEG
jgi:uncharacterized protein YndB with AHSA1/START domain